MQRAIIGAAALLALLGGTAGAATNWADDPASAEADYAASRALCRSVKALSVPEPAAGQALPAKDCSSERLYFGIGMPADPAAARLCALRERAADTDNMDAFGGTAMLMTIYANGRGAPRDPRLAMALACTLGGAPAETDGRVKHLDVLRKDGPGASDFSICDDVTSGFGQGACAAHDSAMAAPVRQAALDGIAATLAPADGAAFAKARAASEAFAKARGENEIDLSGTARAVFEIEAEDAAHEDFLDLVSKVGGKLPPATPAQAATDDKALNDAYRAVMALDDPQWGTPTKDGIKATQRAWLAYRDAVSVFVATRAGQPAATGAVALMTRRRTKELKAFLD